MFLAFFTEGLAFFEKIILATLGLAALPIPANQVPRCRVQQSHGEMRSTIT